MYSGLNFCLHADAAWGGYICTMLDRKKDKKDSRRGGTLMRRGSAFRKVTDQEYVFTSPLNEHSKVLDTPIREEIISYKLIIFGNPTLHLVHIPKCFSFHPYLSNIHF